MAMFHTFFLPKTLLPRLLSWRIFLIAFLVLCFAFATATQASAQLVINEVFPAPASGSEWVELKNMTSNVVSLGGWVVEDDTSALTPVPSFSTNAIAANGYFVFEVSGRLNNSGDSVKLKNPAAQIIDQMTYTSSISDQSWLRSPDGVGEFILSSFVTRGIANPTLQSPAPSPSSSPITSPSPIVSPSPSLFPSPSPTHPSSPSPSPSPTATPNYSDLRLSEIMACPETGQPEWVEFFNAGSSSLTLTNWHFQDSTGNNRQFSATIPAHGYQAIDLSSAILNNDGDTLKVQQQDGSILDTVVLSACTKGTSFIITEDGAALTNVPTKNEPNQANPTPNPTPAPSLSPQPTSSLSSASSISDTTDSTDLEASDPDDNDDSSDTSTQNLYTIPSLTFQNDASQSATLSSSLTTTNPTDLAPELIEPPSSLPFPFSLLQHFLTQATQAVRTQLHIFLIVAIAMIICLVLGGYGAYQWYTEVRANQDLEAG